MATECYCIVLRSAARKATAIYDEELAPLGINIAQFSLLRKLARAAPVSLTELGRLAELDRSTISRNIKLLERMGLVEMSSGADQREAQVMLGAKGLDALKQGARLWARAQKRFETGLGPKAATLMRSTLDSLTFE